MTHRLQCRCGVSLKTAVDMCATGEGDLAFEGQGFDKANLLEVLAGLPNLKSIHPLNPFEADSAVVVEFQRPSPTELPTRTPAAVAAPRLVPASTHTPLLPGPALALDAAPTAVADHHTALSPEAGYRPDVRRMAASTPRQRRSELRKKRNAAAFLERLDKQVLAKAAVQRAADGKRKFDAAPHSYPAGVTNFEEEEAQPVAKRARCSVSAAGQQMFARAAATASLPSAFQVWSGHGSVGGSPAAAAGWAHDDAISPVVPLSPPSPPAV